MIIDIVSEQQEADVVLRNNQDSNSDGLRRRSVSISLTGQAKSVSPTDDSLFAVQDDEDFSAFAKGRDFEPVFVTHKYTEQEKETLNSYESCDYLPSHSHIYKHWIKRQMISNIETDRWVMMGLIGFAVGFLGFVLHQLIEKISLLKWSTTKEFLDDGKVAVGWMFCWGYSMAFAVLAAAVIVLWRPSAGGSGLPEVTGFLNGTQIKKIFSIKTLVAKFISCTAAIGCGMPIGPEGPMIHMGAIMAAGLSQGTSEVFKFKLPFFERFRNPEDRRNFISAGVAAGVSSAFGAPIGGLLFCMEEVSSFWSNTLSWQIFFCCIIATLTTDLFNSSFQEFKQIGTFGGFQTRRYILFNVHDAVDINILMFIPSAILGVLGGLLGSAFTILNLKMSRFRKRCLASISSPGLVKAIRLLEPALVMLVMSLLSIFLPMAFKCVLYTCISGDASSLSEFCVNDTSNKYDSRLREEEETFYTCEKGTHYMNGTTLFSNGTYNELALLLFTSKEEAMKNLYLRNSHRMFNYGPLFVGLIIYFFMVVWAAGTSVAAGILVPMLVIGALYGRILGLIIVDIFGVHLDKSYWNWMDPGAFALIGSASFFSGVARLAPAITSIMMELTNDLKALLPVMTAVVVAKWVGDYLTHPFFHALLELKCIPFLNQQPNVRINKQNVKLELFKASDIMAFPVVTLNLVEHVPTLAQKLLDYTHNGFPVLKELPNGDCVFHGLITRSDLLVILENKDVLKPGPFAPLDDKDLDIAPIGYDAMLRGPEEREQMQEKFLLQFVDNNSHFKNHYIDLTAYINLSAMSVPCKFSLHRAYTLISALGLRHLTVVDERNQVKGIITRKDLMGFHIVETLGNIMETSSYFKGDGRADSLNLSSKAKANPAKSIATIEEEDQDEGEAHLEDNESRSSIRGRSTTLANGVEEKTLRSDSIDEDEKDTSNIFSVPTLEDIHKFSGGATGHKAASFGIRMKGTIKRASHHEKQFEEKAKRNESNDKMAKDSSEKSYLISDVKKKKKKKKEKKTEAEAEVNEGKKAQKRKAKDSNLGDETKESETEAVPRKKSKKKKKNKIESEGNISESGKPGTSEHIQNSSNYDKNIDKVEKKKKVKDNSQEHDGPEDINEKSDNSSKKKEKKKIEKS